MAPPLFHPADDVSQGEALLSVGRLAGLRGEASRPTSSFVCSGGDDMKKAAGRDRHAAATAAAAAVCRHAQNLHHVLT